MTAETGAGPSVYAETGPSVGLPPGKTPILLLLSVFAVAAVGLFLLLNSARTKREAVMITAPAPNAAASTAAPPLELPPPPPDAPAVAPIDPPPPPPVAAAPSAGPVAPLVDLAPRRRSPAVVVDLAGEAVAVQGVNAAAQTVSLPAPAPAPSPLQGAFSGGDRAIATPMRDLSRIVPQGAMLPAVLETAIDSDLPGYTRGVISLDVLAFDGRTVLIPRGSRLIGQYRSATALGQSRAFVIWERLIRSDGVSVQIGSPGADDLGRGGLAGKVDRHFFTRFGGSILLSVLNAGIAAVGDTPQTQIAIGSPAAAGAAAASAQFGDQVVPTVRVAQGEAIRVFLARDLDFSAVGPVK